MNRVVRNQRWIWSIAILGLALGGLLAIVIAEQHAPLSAEEQPLVGRWYGLLREADGLECSILVDDYRPDRAVSITLRRFSRERADGSAPWQAFPVVQADQVHGRWRMHARVIEWELLDLPDRPTWWQQFVTLIRERRWRSGGPETLVLDVTNLTSATKRFSHRTVSTELDSIRVPDDFQIPDEPMEPDAALTWWQRGAEN